jgi:N6-L-threonylcarbamoyladenine synthase
LPRPFFGAAHADLSFAGLKTAAARAFAAGADPADLAASFQRTVADILADRTRRALGFAPARPTALVLAGGVAANRTVRAALADVAASAELPLRAPPARWCTDNAAMIALAGGLWRLQGRADALDVPARPRWPLDAAAAADRPILGAGRKGPKA